MKVEVVFTGLCSFLNVRDNHGDDMVEPSIILVRTDVDVDAGTPGPGYVEGRNPEDPEGTPVLQHDHDEEEDHAHTPFIAFSGNRMTTTFPEFEPIAETGFLMYSIPPGKEIAIAGVAAGKPVVVQSYDTIAKKDHYWPAAQNHWNRDYVPVKGERPDPHCVAAFMRFGKGFIGAGRLCPLEWTFQDSIGRTLTNQFAEEGIYTFDQPPGDIVITLTNLEGAPDPIEIRLTPIPPPDNRPLSDQTIFIGNNMEDDIERAVLRAAADNYRDGDHFRFLNAVSYMPTGPFPAFGRRVNRSRPSAASGGSGSTSGACGPHSSNG
ncbi:MAG: hypothetical protein JOZ54_02095 [Acidobacteria bacterium]|nr:hypothetical protein [Acidobacteriota bacterium]